MNFLGLNTTYGNPASIISHNVAGTNVYEALLAPQTIKQGVIFISVKLGGISYTYTLKDNDIELEAGNRYNYTLRVNAGILELVGSTITGWTDIPEVEGDVTPNYVVMTDGTYIVYTAEGLYAWANHVNAENLSTNCILENDIVLPAVPEGGSNWVPAIYNGIFDGKNHIIKGMTINLPEQDYVGFLLVLGKGGEVKNLKLKDVNVLGGRICTGSIAGLNNGGVITNCYSEGKLEGNDYVGGIAGNSMSGSIILCKSAANVIGKQYTGGIVGYNVEDIIECDFSGIVTGTESVGGVVGLNLRDYEFGVGDVIACNFTGKVSGTTELIGGIVGSNGGKTVACYSTGDVSGQGEKIGGVVGGGDGIVTACYATGNVVGGTIVGGIIGYNQNTNVKSCYWSGNAASGIGLGSGSATKVEGNVTWEAATASMNSALETENSEWRYVQGYDKNIPPILQKQ